MASKANLISTLFLLFLATSYGFDLPKNQQKLKSPSPSPSAPLTESEDPSSESEGSSAESKTTTPWPASKNRAFTYNIADGIEGASQIRHETIENGVMKGYYTYALGDGLYELVNYIADENGYRVTSSETMTEKQLLASQGLVQNTQPGSANVDIDNDGVKTAYNLVKDKDVTGFKTNTITGQQQQAMKPKPIPQPTLIKSKRSVNKVEEEKLGEIKKKFKLIQESKGKLNGNSAANKGNHATAPEPVKVNVIQH